MKVVNPATGSTIREYDEMSLNDAFAILESVDETFLSWRRTSFSHRSGLMKKAAAVLRARSSEYAVLMAEEMGKPVVQGRAEVEKCAWTCEYYADHTEEYLAPDIIATDAQKSYVTYNPLGVVLAVMPWNFPLWQVFRFAAPGLMAGNVGLLKHASNVPGSALAIEEVFRGAGFPPNAFRTLLIGSSAVGELIAHPRVAASTLTGSGSAGKAVGGASGAALKPSVLELGGSDPYLILEDADIAAAAATCAASRLINAGQSCVAAKRFVVVEPVREEFEKLFVANMKAAVMGDPLDEATTIGPMARHDLRDELHEQTTESTRKGARCLLGGEIPDGRGAYYPPTVLTDVAKGMPAYDDELFGPVASIIAVADEAEGIRVANDTVFGLGAAVFTRDVERGERIAAEELEAGCCFVNTFVKSDPRIPFGGIKGSGYGRELADHGMKEFMNTKTVYVQ